MRNETTITSYEVCAYLLLEGIPLLDVRPDRTNPRRLLFIFLLDDEFTKAIDAWKAGATVPAQQYADKLRQVKYILKDYFNKREAKQAAKDSAQGQ